MTYDPETGMIYVANYVSQNVSVINPNTNMVVGSISTGLDAWALLFDPMNGLIYVGNDYSNVVTVLDPVNLTIVGNISTGSNYNPIYLRYDPYNANIYAACDVSGSIVVINATYNLVSSVIDFGPSVGTGSIAVTPWNNYLYIGNWYSDTVTVVNGTNNSIASTIAVGDNYPAGDIFDPLNGMVYVTLKGPYTAYEHTVVAIDPATNKVVTSMPDFMGPDSLAYDPVDRVLAVGNFGSGNITFINASSGLLMGNMSLDAVTNSACNLFYYAPGNVFYSTNQFSSVVVPFQFNQSLLSSVHS